MGLSSSLSIITACAVINARKIPLGKGNYVK